MLVEHSILLTRQSLPLRVCLLPLMAAQEELVHRQEEVLVVLRGHPLLAQDGQS